MIGRAQARDPRTASGIPATAVQHAPGRTTLVDGGDAEQTHALASAGTAGPRGRLPFFEQIQRSFGRHDIGGIGAHTGGAAADANAQMGSRAFARGTDVAFGGAPDLHTAAHEAAHVVQQRAGVSLAGGVGAAGDAYERHADAVADRVVAGGSTEGLLDQTIGGGGATSAVQHQQMSVPPNASAGASTTLAQRMRTAIGANDLAAVTALQQEARQAHQRDPSTADANEALASGRKWLMDTVAATRRRFAQRIADARAGAATGASQTAATAQPGDHTSAVEGVEIEMDRDCAPYLDALLQGDPQHRYDHPDAIVQDEVFQAVRLHSVRRGVGQIGHRDAAETESRHTGGLGADDEWCGAFAYTQQARGGGMDPHWAVDMQGTDGIVSALSYRGSTAITWIWTGSEWQNVQDFHRARGSWRYYEEVHQTAPAHGIHAGDIVLFDNMFGTNPDHITTAISFDGRYLTTVGGNQGAGEQGVSRTNGAIDLTENPEPNDVRDHDEHGRPVRRRRAGAHKHVRVHGVGRWSIVDYERHIYRTSRTRPTTPPTAREGRGTL